LSVAGVLFSDSSEATVMPSRGCGRILMLFGDSEDYLADSLFHGLRTLLGEDAVDYPSETFSMTPAAPLI
jgi:hypothetical protein